MKRLLGVGLLVVGIPLSALAAAPRIALHDYRTLIDIASPQFSPDGNRLAFLTVRSDFVHDRYDAALRVLDLGDRRMVTAAQGLRDLHSPRWAPDSRTLAFIAVVGKETPQIYTVSATGGTPRQLGDAPQGVEQFAWAPNGHTLVYVTPGPSPLTTSERRTRHDLFTIHDDDYLIHKQTVPSHLWLLDVATSRTRQLTFGQTSMVEVTPPFGGGVSAPVWSADGNWIAYTQQATPDDSDSDRTRIVAVNVATGKEHPITGKVSYEYNPEFAPQGDSLAWLYPHGPGPVSDMDLMISAIDGGARDVSAKLDRDLLPSLAWLPDGHAIVGMADDHVGVDLYVQPLHGDGHAIDLGGLNALAFAVSSRGAIAVVADNATQAPELYLLRTTDAKPVRMTDFNTRFAAYEKARSVELTWKAPDGQMNDGILTYPVGYVAGRKYPLVVYSHGGPEASSSEGFDTNEIGPLRGVFAAEGYLVFEPNYRGSDNLGTAHEHAIFADPGKGPDSDVISGIETLEKQGIVEASRIAAVGHSYGGFMTAWLIAHQHFWKCAVVADGAVDWTEEYELSGTGNLAWARDSLGGTPWEKASAALYRTGSAITYAGAITTPTLILSGTDDVVVPITESFALYHALASREVPVKFIGIPGAHHLPQDPVHLALYYAAINRWVEQYLGT
ncbi:MAG: prolyl oligopeptidase family serine peptidase [Rhodanobacteraceae bacterium]